MTTKVQQFTVSSTEDLALKWLDRASNAQKAHRTCTKFYYKLNLILGIASTILSTIVGTSVFVSLSNNPSSYMQILVGLLSLLAAVISGLMTFLKLSESAIKHENSSAKYSSTCRQIEYSLTSQNSINLDEIKSRLDELAADCPSIPEFLWQKSLAQQ